MNLGEIALWMTMLSTTEFGVLLLYDWWKDRNKIDVGCDVCMRILHPRALTFHKTKRRWLCKKCTRIVNAEMVASAADKQE